MGVLRGKSRIQEKEQGTFPLPQSKQLLLIFTKNPVLGKCKTRLAKDVGEETALEVYRFLLERAQYITQEIEADKWVYYSEEIWENDGWSTNIYQKHLQRGKDLGEKMYHAFEDGFQNGYEKVVIIGCDIYEMQSSDIESAFNSLENNDYVIGPALDGGYYLLGMRQLREDIFQNKNWGTDSVLGDTLSNLQGEKWVLLDERNDVDTYDDIKEHHDFTSILQNRKTC